MTEDQLGWEFENPVSGQVKETSIFQTESSLRLENDGSHVPPNSSDLFKAKNHYLSFGETLEIF